MIIFVYGEDAYQAQLYVHDLVDKFRRDRDPGGYNFTRFLAREATAGEMLSIVRAAPFMAEKRMVRIDNPLSLPADAVAEVAEVFEGVPEFTILVVLQTEPVGKSGAAKKLFETLKAEKYSREFLAPTPVKTEQFISNYVTSRGGTLETGVAGFIVAEVSGDMWELSHALDQMIAYAKGRAITRVDAELFITTKTDDNVFRMVEAIMNGNKPLALRLLREQHEAGEESLKIVGAIAWQLRQVGAIAGFLEESPQAPSETVAQALKLHPFVVKKNLALARRMPLAVLAERVRSLLAVDRAIKTGGGDATVLLDRFVMGG